MLKMIEPSTAGAAFCAPYFGLLRIRTAYVKQSSDFLSLNRYSETPTLLGCLQVFLFVHTTSFLPSLLTFLVSGCSLGPALELTPGSSSGLILLLRSFDRL